MPQRRERSTPTLVNAPGSRKVTNYRSKPDSIDINMPASRPVSPGKHGSFVPSPGTVPVTRTDKPGRRVGRNPTPGIPRKVGSINVKKKNDEDERKEKIGKLIRRRRAVARRMAAKRKNRNKG